jgi:hypothetical protein
MKYGNCWVYALPKWLRHPWTTYLVIRFVRKPNLPIPHVFFAKSIAGLEVEEFQPIERKPVWWKAIFHKLWYRGRIRKGWGEE